ncbi:MAG TPA: signal peptidase I [Phenylobacterium sp.]
MSQHVQAADASPAKPGALKETFELIKTIVYALAIAFVIRVLLFQPFTIPSASMEPNLLIGDYIIVSKYSYGYSRHSIPLSPPLFKGRIFERTPHRGDVIVFKLPSDGKKDYIKRLIGLPGDRIRMINGALYINGQPVPRRYEGVGIDESPYGADRPFKKIRETFDSGASFITADSDETDVDNTEEYVVPEGHYFFMGDNRDNSSDSRVSPLAGGVGFVPAENLQGKAEVVLLSWNQASLLKPWTWFTTARPDRFFKLVK